MTTKFSQLLFSVAAVFCLFQSNEAQAQKYVPPADIIGDGFRITITDIESEKDNSSFKATFFNTSRDQFLSVNPHKMGIEFVGSSAEGVYYYNSSLAKMGKQNFIVEPGDDQSKVIKVVGEFEHRMPQLIIHIDGLKQGKMPSSPMAVGPFMIKAGDKEVKGLDGFNFGIQKVSSKGGLTIKTLLEFPEYPADTYLIAFDKNKATASSADGATLGMKISTIGKTVFDYDSDVKATFKFEEEVSSASLNLANAFRKIELSDVSVPPTEVSTPDAKEKKPAKEKPVKEAKPVKEKPVKEVKEEPKKEVNIPTLCDEYVNTKATGTVLVRIVSEDAGCFRVHSAGKELNSEFTSSLTFNSNPGIFATKVYMDNGEVIEKKIVIGEDYKVAYFNVKEKKGKYSLKLSLVNSQPIDGAGAIDAVKPSKLSETDTGEGEIMCRDKFIMWNSSSYKQNLTVVGLTKTHIRYIDCELPGVVLEMDKKKVSVIEYSGGEEDWMSNIENANPYPGLKIIRSREDMYQRHLRK